MSILKKKGFTLIELMVVIVIIGVLASLAIPRFTSASDKAKTAEAPRVVASFESAYLAAIAEYGWSPGTGLALGDIPASSAIMFDTPGNDSKWFFYPTITDAQLLSGNLLASARVKMGPVASGATLGTRLDTGAGDAFNRCASAQYRTMIPNYAVSGMPNC